MIRSSVSRLRNARPTNDSDVFCSNTPPSSICAPCIRTRDEFEHAWRMIYGGGTKPRSNYVASIEFYLFDREIGSTMISLIRSFRVHFEVDDARFESCQVVLCGSPPPSFEQSKLTYRSSVYIYIKIFEVIFRKKVWIQVSKGSKEGWGRYQGKHMADLAVHGSCLAISGKSEEEESALSSDFFCPRANRMSFQRERERGHAMTLRPWFAISYGKEMKVEEEEIGFPPSFFFSVIRKKLKDWKRTPGWNVRAFLMKVAIAGARFWWNFVNWQMRSISSKRKDTSNRFSTNVIDTNRKNERQ